MFIPSHSRIISHGIFITVLSALLLMFQIMEIPPFPLRASSAVWCHSSPGSPPLHVFPLPFFFPSDYSKLYPPLLALSFPSNSLVLPPFKQLWAAIWAIPCCCLASILVIFPRNSMHPAFFYFLFLGYIGQMLTLQSHPEMRSKLIHSQTWSSTSHFCVVQKTYTSSGLGQGNGAIQEPFQAILMLGCWKHF